MKGRRMTLAVLAVSLCGGAAASEIYKWIDENGNVHYEDRPSGAATEQRLAMTYSRTDSGAVQKGIEARLERDAARAEKRAARDEEKQAAEDAKAEADARQKKCAQYRRQLETMVQAQRLYRVGEDGERSYLDDAQRQEARQKAEELIAETCN